MASKIRDRIIAHALRCFARRGFAGCSTKEIAASAKVTEGSLFRLFTSKEKLFTEALALALNAKAARRPHLRMFAFALLEGKGLSEPNRKGLRKMAASHPVVRHVREISAPGSL